MNMDEFLQAVKNSLLVGVSIGAVLLTLVLLFYVVLVPIGVVIMWPFFTVAERIKYKKQALEGLKRGDAYSVYGNEGKVDSDEYAKKH
jgi:hypothetical protein